MSLPELLADHDVSGGSQMRTLSVWLNPGDSLTASEVTFVDLDAHELIASGAPDVFGDADCTSPVLERGLIRSDPISGDLWGVNLYLQNGTANQTLTLQWTYRKASQPNVDSYDEYYRVRTVA